LHLSIHIRINLCKIGSGLRIHTCIVSNLDIPPTYNVQFDMSI